MKKTILLLLILVVYKVSAQVTIGADAPPIGGAMLELKEYESTDTDLTTTNKGFSHARVALTRQRDLYPMYPVNYPGVADIAAEKKANEGLVVYNVTDNKIHGIIDFFVPGLYIWDGNIWTLFRADKVVLPTIESILCETATLTPAHYSAGDYYTGILKVSYTGGSGGNFDSSHFSSIPLANGLTFEGQAGKLNVGNGDIYYKVTGIPTFSSPTTTSPLIDFLGKSCVATVGDMQYIKTISFTKKTAVNFTTSDVADKTITTLGNLSVRVEYVGNTYFFTYRTGIPTHTTVLYTKSGASVGYMVTGKKAANNADVWYRVKMNASGGDAALIFDESASGGPTGSKDDLNPSNRDVIQAIFMLHNTNEVYRATINGNGAINETGTIAAMSPTITTFLEKLD